MQRLMASCLSFGRFRRAAGSTEQPHVKRAEDMGVEEVNTREGCHSWHTAHDDRNPILNNPRNAAFSAVQFSVCEEDLHADQLLALYP